MKEFIGNFLRNVAILAVIAIVLLIMFPDMMSQVYGVYGALGIPFVLAFIVMAALPRRRRSRG
ncbi:MAG: hypothetical protein D9V45_13830 [Chloroflexi bacterium]|nr:hypothetical protein [Anaerolinea sp.]TDA63472.1 MAG: hypothetical protein D9V45_13830 [Chloroflexota bacterium]